MTSATRRIEAPRALRAVRAIVANPDDIAPVFTLLEALSGDTLGRMQKRLSGSAKGMKLLGERPEITLQLEDREALRSLPEESLGRAYLRLAEEGNITSEGIREAARMGQEHEADLPEDIAYLHGRMRDTHDLWHTVTGYRNDVLGEVALLAFTLAQTWNPGIGVLVAVGLFKTHHAPQARSVILEGFRRGRRSAWLPEEPWEELLALPLATVRARFGLDALPAYIPVHSADLRAAA